MGDVVRALEGNYALTECVQHGAGSCNQADTCIARWVWVEASEAMFDKLDSISFSNLVRRARNAGGFEDPKPCFK